MLDTGARDVIRSYQRTKEMNEMIHADGHRRNDEWTITVTINGRDVLNTIDALDYGVSALDDTVAHTTIATLRVLRKAINSAAGTMVADNDEQ